MTGIAETARASAALLRVKILLQLRGKSKRSQMFSVFEYLGTIFEESIKTPSSFILTLDLASVLTKYLQLIS